MIHNMEEVLQALAESETVQRDCVSQLLASNTTKISTYVFILQIKYQEHMTSRVAIVEDHA